MILGITGHQNLEEFNIEWITNELREFILKNEIEKGISSLAIGADQLFVKELKQSHIIYDVIIPCENYELTFKTEDDLKNYLSLKSSSGNTVILDYKEPSEQAFYSAGVEMVRQSTYIVAIWNGYEAKGLGGTADIVKRALQQKKEVYHINPVLKQSFYL